MTSELGALHAALWTKAQYPGDNVRMLYVKRGEERGQICIKLYDDKFAMVGSYLPGVTSCFPGDTPKTWPEKSAHCYSAPEADRVFDEYVQEAYADLWQNDNEAQANYERWLEWHNKPSKK